MLLSLCSPFNRPLRVSDMSEDKVRQASYRVAASDPMSSRTRGWSGGIFGTCWGPEGLLSLSFWKPAKLTLPPYSGSCWYLLL